MFIPRFFPDENFTLEGRYYKTDIVIEQGFGMQSTGSRYEEILAELEGVKQDYKLDKFLKDSIHSLLNESKTQRLSYNVGDDEALKAVTKLADIATYTIKKIGEKYGTHSGIYQDFLGKFAAYPATVDQVQDYVNMPEKIESLANEVIALSKDKNNKELFTQKSKELGALMQYGIYRSQSGNTSAFHYLQLFSDAQKLIDDLPSDEIMKNIELMIAWGDSKGVLFGEEYSVSLKDGTVLRAFNDYSYTEVIIEKNDEVLITNVENVKFETLMSLFDKKELSRKNEENKAMQELNNKASQFKNLANLSPAYLSDTELKEINYYLDLVAEKYFDTSAFNTSSKE